MSMRAAIQPSAKNNAGIGSSHQSSKSMRVLRWAAWSEPRGRGLEARTRCGSGARCGRMRMGDRRPGLAPLLASEAAHLAGESRDLDCGRQHAERDTGGERDQHDEDERRLPCVEREEANGHRLRVLQGEGGISGCGNAQNCAQVCPKKIPLTESIAKMGRDVTKQAVHDMLSLPDAYIEE